MGCRPTCGTDQCFGPALGRVPGPIMLDRDGQCAERFRVRMNVQCGGSPSCDGGTERTKVGRCCGTLKSMAIGRSNLTSRAAIFDVDGTLVDSVDSHALAWQEALAHFGHRFSFRAVRAQIGKGGDQLLPVFLSPAQIKVYGEELTAYRAQLFRRKYLKKVRPFPGVRALVIRLRRERWKVAVASSGEKTDVNFYLRLCGISRLLDAVISADDAPQSKPHPDIFHAALRKLGRVAPAHAIVIGDSPYDAIAAKKAKIACLGFLSGGFGRVRLRSAGCRRVYRGPADLLRHYRRSAFAAG